MKNSKGCSASPSPYLATGLPNWIDSLSAFHHETALKYFTITTILSITADYIPCEGFTLKSVIHRSWIILAITLLCERGNYCFKRNNYSLFDEMQINTRAVQLHQLVYWSGNTLESSSNLSFITSWETMRFVEQDWLIWRDQMTVKFTQWSTDHSTFLCQIYESLRLISLVLWPIIGALATSSPGRRTRADTQWPCGDEPVSHAQHSTHSSAGCAFWVNSNVYSRFHK